MDVHAYDHADVLAGQGTAGREFELDAPDLTHILVATGGGGLIGGVSAWYAGSAIVVSVEPEGCPTLHDALRAGHPVRCAGRRCCRRQFGRAAGGRGDVPDCPALRRRRPCWSRTKRSGRRRPAVGTVPDRGGTRRCDRDGGASVRPIPGAGRVPGWHLGMRRKHRSANVPHPTINPATAPPWRWLGRRQHFDKLFNYPPHTTGSRSPEQTSGR